MPTLDKHNPPMDAQINKAVDDAALAVGNILRLEHELEGGDFVRALARLRDLIRNTEVDWCALGDAEPLPLAEPSDPNQTIGWD